MKKPDVEIFAAKIPDIDTLGVNRPEVKIKVVKIMEAKKSRRKSFGGEMAMNHR